MCFITFSIDCKTLKSRFFGAVIDVGAKYDLRLLGLTPAELYVLEPCFCFLLADLLVKNLRVPVRLDVIVKQFQPD